MTNHSKLVRLVLITVWMLVAFAARSQSDPMEIIKPGAIKSPIDLSRLTVSGGSTAAAFKKVLKEDLQRSGWFTLGRPERSAFAVLGSCSVTGSRLSVPLRVYNTATERVQLKKTFTAQQADHRQLAHEVCDAIVYAIKRRPGIASTRIVMVGTRSRAKEIFVCDSDGHNLRQVTTDGSISVAPAWMPDGSGLVYTSFRATFPYIYMISFEDGHPTRRRITDFPGLNACASVSPTGRQMALSLSKDGNPDLYVMDLQSLKSKRVTRTRRGAEASPSWSPDGRQIVFVSDTAGKPHLYVMNADGSGTRRLSYSGSENVDPDWGQNGLIVYSSRRGGQYQVCVIDPATGADQELTSGAADHEDPSWAPDGRHVVFARTERYESDLYILDTMGNGLIRLTRGKGDWYSPAWSPK